MSVSDPLDNRILAAVQSDFPVCRRPFRELARKLEVGEDLLLARVRSLREQGVIRRFGAVFDSRRLGYVSTLVALEVPNEEDLPGVAAAVNRYPEATHNYQREDRFNLWFTLIARSRERIGEIISRVASLETVAGVMDLPAEELYKIRASFTPLDDETGEA
ncbi:MAG: AsnC family transcriptional regulator [Candidatus Glassbacteria bacterium]|nr:AsnC family transcriptional regulator [Candidatus Glassbacteria bacterium]